jgi:hypothetical protein
MPILAGRDEAGHDEVEELIADLETLVSCGLVTKIRQIGGQTRYGVAARGDDRGGGELGAVAGDVFAPA